MTKFLSVLALAAMMMMPVYGTITWQGKNIPAGVKANGAKVVKAAKLGDFQIYAGTMDVPEIAAVFAENFPGKKLTSDGFFLIIDGKKITVGSLVARGLVYGITHAAEKLNNYSAPRPFGQDRVVPGNAKVDFKYKHFSNPAFDVRGFVVCSFNNVHGTFAEWMIRNRYNAGFGSIRFTDAYYDAVTNYGIPWYTSGHSLYYWLPGSYSKTNPEFFPLINGKRKFYKGNYAVGIQLNVGNKGLQDLVVNRIVDFAKKYPECKYIALSVNDGGGWGESPEERAFDDPDEYTRHVYSTRFFRFANLIAERVAKINPDIKIVTLAYLRCVEPPKLEKLSPNIVVKLCTYRRCYKCRLNDPECRVNRRWNKLLTDWKRFGNPIHIYDYIHLGGSPEFPMPDLRILQKDLQYYKSIGVTGYDTEITVDGGPIVRAAPKFKGKGFYRSKPEAHDRYWTGVKMVFHQLGKLLWDPELDYEKSKQEYFVNFFGPAANAMSKIFKLVEKRWEEDKACYVWSGAYTNFPQMLFKRGDEKLLNAYLIEAEKAVAAIPYYAENVKKEAALIRKLWITQMDAKSKELRLKNGKGVIGKGDFVSRSKRGAIPAKYPSKIELAIKGDKLHIKGEFIQPAGTILAQNPGRDGSKNFGDTFEIFIDAGPGNPKDGSYQFIVSAGGGLWDGQLRSSEWNSTTTFKTTVKKDRWSADVVIPLKELGYNKITKGMILRANFVIIRNKLKDISGWSSTALEGRSSLGNVVVE